MSSQCQIPQFGACCCTCKHHVEDFHACSVDIERCKKEGCICSKHKGWICLGMNYGKEPRAHSGWGEHGMCELHEAIEGRQG